MSMQWGLIAFALVAGAALPVQAGINAQLTKHLGHSLHAAFVSFVVGSVGLFVLGRAYGLVTPRWSAVPLSAPWLWTGGLLGALYVGATIALAPRLGAATTIGLIIAGQLLASVVLDHFGWVGFPLHEASVLRVVGVTLILLGITLVARY